MDIEKLIERMRSHRGALFKAQYKQDMDDAATALAALVEARVEGGELRSEAAADELSKYGFDDWYAELTSILSNLLKG